MCLNFVFLTFFIFCCCLKLLEYFNCFLRNTCTYYLKNDIFWTFITGPLLDFQRIKKSTLVPLFLSRPKDANQVPPRRHIVGATATVSTLVTVVGHPNKPISAGNGGFRRGLPCLPSSDSINALSMQYKKLIDCKIS